MAQTVETAVPVAQIKLRFRDGAASKIADSLSAVEQVDRSLWLGGDESASIVRMTTDDFVGYGGQKCFPLAAFFELPAGPKGEVDLEGLAFDAEHQRLWLVGSHSLRRKRPKRGQSGKDARKALKEIDRQANRYLLGSVKLAAGEPVAGSGRAMALSPTSSELVALLEDDPRLGPFLAIPSKDNGFDIEGLAVSGGGVFLGLRGPVLRGWASILQLRLEHDGNGRLLPKPPAGDGKPYLHHLLDLDGLGVRDLTVHGDDLLILAGPTMDLDGPMRLFRWPGAFGHSCGQCMHRDQLQALFEVPWGAHADHAEGMALFAAGASAARLVVVLDSPNPGRFHGEDLAVDLFSL
jgi:hypothetical protein